MAANKKAGVVTLQRYRLISDNDGHDYVIPEGQEKNFYEWVVAEETGQESEFDFEHCRMNTHNLTFTDPQGYK